MINKNYLESGMEISSNNTFTKIIDFNNKGKNAFMSFLPEECYI